MTPAQLIKRHQEIKRTKELMETEYKESVAPYTEALDAIELSIMEYLNANGLQNFKSPDGTAYKKSHVQCKMVDRQALVAYVRASDNFDIFTNSLTKDAVQAYVEANKAAPPGVEVTTVQVVNIRKS